MSYTYTDASTGVTYLVEGRRVYRITERGNLVWDHDAVLDPPPAWWRRLLDWWRRLLARVMLT